MKNKNLTITALALCGICTLFAGLVISDLIRARDAPAPYFIADWQINYAAGFVRRGVLGELARALFVRLGIDTRTTVLAMQVLFYIVYYGASVVLLTPVIAGSPRFAFAALTPITLAFPPLDHFKTVGTDTAGAKDIVFLALLFVQAVLCTRDRTHPAQSGKRLFVLSIVWAFVVLVHEALFFFLPFSLACLLLTSPKRIKRSTLIMMALPPVIAFVASGLATGDGHYVAVICSSLGAGAPDACEKAGAIAWLGRPARVNLMATYYVIVQPPFILLATVLAASVGGIGLALALTDSRIAEPIRVALRVRSNLLLTIACVVAPLPLFAVSDHGRFLHIWFTSASAVIAAYLLRIRAPDMPVGVEWHERGLFGVVASTLWIALFAAYSMSWSVQGGCCPDRLGSGFLGRIAAVLSGN